MGLCYSSLIPSGTSPHNDTRTSSNVSSTILPSSAKIEGEILEYPDSKIFSFADLRKATKNFHVKSVIGEGGFGYVYRGSIDEHSLHDAAKSTTCVEVAVKMLQRNGRQGQQEWLAEIKYLGQLCHPNLVKLIGYSIEQDRRLLVYEFMRRSSLERNLHERNPLMQPLSWDLRLKIALGIAKGLAFLHNTAKVIHRDLKSSNILLDSNFNAKISGFGFSRDRPESDDKTHVTTRTVCTMGYAAPEYTDTGHVTIKSDVYSFGVVLLELVSGYPAAHYYRRRHPGMKQSLVEWAKPLLSNRRKSIRVIDVHIEGKYAITGARKAANLAAKCLSLDRDDRPKMEEVVKALEQI